MSKSKTKCHFQGKECFSRMNFLYQASLLMAGKNNTLSSYYGKLCKNVGKKAVLRIDPTIKRDFCKRCSVAQKPGITSNVEAIYLGKRRKTQKRIEQIDENTQIQQSCSLCGYRRNFNINDEYKFWLENAESVAEICIVKTDQKPNYEDNKYATRS